MMRTLRRNEANDHFRRDRQSRGFAPVITLVLLWLLVWPVGASDVSGGTPTVESFRAMLQLPPSQYAEERGKLLAQGDRALPFLKERQKLGASWYERAMATALALRIESPKVCDSYEKAMFPHESWISGGFGDGGWFVPPSGEPTYEDLTPFAKEGNRFLPFLIERLFSEPVRRIRDGSVSGYHMILPQRGAQMVLKHLGGKDAARAIAVAVLAGDRSSPAVYQASLLSDEELVGRLIPLLHVEGQTRAAWALRELQAPRAVPPSSHHLPTRTTPSLTVP